MKFCGVIRSYTAEDQKDPWNIITGSAGSRLRAMCEMPSYEALKERLEQYER